MKDSLTKYIIVFLIGMALMFTLKQCNTKEIKVPFRVEVEVPVVEVQHDTIYKPNPIPYPVKEVDTTLLEEYKKANDSLKQKLFESAVTVNEYKEVFEDSIQTITVDANVTGKLNSIAVGYKTKPRTIVVDTSLTVEVPENSRSLSPYIETGIPTQIELNPNIVFKGGIDYTTKKNWTYGLSYDTEKRVWLKIGKRFNF